MNPDRCIHTYDETRRPCLVVVDEIACIVDKSTLRESLAIIVLKSGYELKLNDENLIDKIIEVNKIEKDKLNKKDFIKS